MVYKLLAFSKVPVFYMSTTKTVFDTAHLSKIRMIYCTEIYQSSVKYIFNDA